MNSPVAGVSAAIGTIAWLDDDIKNYEHWVEALRQEGLRIDTFSAQTGLLNSLSRSKYDLIILDERLQRSSFGTALVAQIHKKNPDATFLLLSAYIVPENIQSKIDDLKQAIPDLQIYALSKSVVPPWKMSAFYSVFVRPILDIVKGVTSAIPFIRTAKPAGSSSGRFNISFDDYCDLPEQARFDLSSEFAKEKERVLDRFFATGAVWVCFYGDTDEPDFVAYDIAQVPPHSKIDSEAADKGIAAFCFGSPHRIESVSHPPLTETTSKCSRISGLQNYNFFKCGIGDLQLTAHFDSGAADVYLNSRLLMDNAIIRETVTATHIKTSIGVIFAQIEHLQFIIDLDGGFTEVVNHPVYAVRNYFTSVLAASAICGLECRTDTASICRFRQPGLIGRGPAALKRPRLQSFTRIRGDRNQMIHFWTLVSGLLGYLAFEVFEARKRWLANRKDNSVFRELAGMWLALIFFGIASAAFAEYIVNGVPTPQNVSWTFAVDPFIRGLAAGFALIPMITRFNSSLDEKRTENIVVSKTKPSFRDMIGEYLRQRR